MNTAEGVKTLLNELKQQVVSRPNIIRKLAEYCLDWPYVYAAAGEMCEPEWRKDRMGYSDEKYARAIKDNCPVLSGKQPTIYGYKSNSNERIISPESCVGCKWYGVRCFDCRGFTRWLLAQVGISLAGGGATSQWDTASNWVAKGEIKTMPRGLVCCVFKRRESKMSHTGMSMGDGNGSVIHCSTIVKRGNAFTDASPWTHWAIPAGLYTTEELRKAGLNVDESKNVATLRRGSSGDEVEELQLLLNARYGAGLDMDGVFGAKTEAAVKAFQKAKGLTVDGIVGPKTWAALGVNSTDTKPNSEIIWETLYDAIKNPHAVAGLMGNLYAESGLNPSNLQNTGNNALGMTDTEYTAAVDSGTYTAKQFENDNYGYGLAQWTYSTRKKALLDYAVNKGASIGDLSMQLSFLLDELRFSYSGVWYALVNSASVREASDTVLLKYERPKNQSEENQIRRAELGQKYFDQYANLVVNEEPTNDEVEPETGSSTANVEIEQDCVKVSLSDWQAIKAAFAVLSSTIKKYEEES